MKPFVGIKKIWYGAPITAAVTVASLKAWLESAKEVKNSHQDTWGYTEDDPSVTDYINELTGQTYFRDVTAKGARTIAFTMGEYSFENKKELQGGTLVKEGENIVGWQAPDVAEIINKAIVGQTKTGNYVVFTNAAVVGKGNFVEKNIGLGVSAVAMANPNAGVADEYWLDGEKMDTPAA